MYVADAHIPKLKNAVIAPPNVRRCHWCASSSGTNISAFFAHWCSRIAFSQLRSAGPRSSNRATATVPVRFIPARSARSGFATIGDTQAASSSTSGRAFPM